MRLVWAAPVALLFFACVAVCMRGGWLYGRRRLKNLGDSFNDGLGTVDAAIFGMMGLLLAFTFTGAASRFDDRRQLIVQETNIIGTAWLRLDLLQPVPREQARALFRDYLDARIALYEDVSDLEVIDRKLADIAALQSRIWLLLQEQAREDKSLPLAQTVLPQVNDMFDIATSRYLATQMHPPELIFAMLGMLVLVSAFLAGFGQAKVARQSVLHLFGFAATTAVALYVIIDLEFPRVGLIRVDDFDEALLALRESMN